MCQQCGVRGPCKSTGELNRFGSKLSIVGLDGAHRAWPLQCSQGCGNPSFRPFAVPPCGAANVAAGVFTSCKVITYAVHRKIKAPWARHGITQANCFLLLCAACSCVCAGCCCCFLAAGLPLHQQPLPVIRADQLLPGADRHTARAAAGAVLGGIWQGQ